MESTKEMLGNVNVGDLVKDKGYCYIIGEKSPIRYCLEQLSARNFLSVPVQSGETGEIIGIVNILDILSYVVGFVVDKVHTEDELDRIALEKLDRDISLCLGLTRESQSLWYYQSTDPILKVMEAFHKGIHRVIVQVPLEGKEGKSEYKFLTQTDVIKYINWNIGTFGSDVDKKLGDTSVFQEKKIYSINYKKSAYDAFSLMMIKDLTALPIVDDSEHVIEHISASDLRSFEPMNLKSLLHPLTDFIRNTKRKHENVITCKKSTTIREVIVKMIDCKIHTIWITDDHHSKLIGSVSMSDIIAFFSPL